MLRPLAAVASIALAASPLSAQVGLASSARTVVLTALKHGSVSVALPGGGSATLAGDLGFGPNDFAPVAVETAWDLDPSETSAVSLVAYFHGMAGGTAVLFSQPITAGSSTGTRTDQLHVRIDLSGWTSLPAGQYQGTLNLMAVTQ
jgi:hypothetical protein